MRGTRNVARESPPSTPHYYRGGPGYPFWGGLAFSHDRRRGLALPNLSAARDAEKRDDDSRSESNLFHGNSPQDTRNVQDKRE
jgi:hypothetical protein